MAATLTAGGASAAVAAAVPAGGASAAGGAAGQCTAMVVELTAEFLKF